MKNSLLLTCLSVTAAHLALAAEPITSFNSTKYFNNDKYTYPQQAVKPLSFKIPNVNPIKAPRIYTDEEVKAGNELVKRVLKEAKKNKEDSSVAAKPTAKDADQLQQNTIKETVQTQAKPAEQPDTAAAKDRQHSPVQGEVVSPEVTDTAASVRSPAIKEKPQIVGKESHNHTSKAVLSSDAEDSLPVQENAALAEQESFIKNTPVVPISQIKGTRKTYKDISGQVDSALEEVKTKSSGIHPDKIKLNTSPRVTITPGINEYIPIAKNHVNRIVTPFVSPSITSIGLTAGNNKDGTCGEICVKGNVIYVSTDKNDAVSMFITEQGSEEQALSITLVPQNIPPREVFLQLSAEAKGSKAASDSLAQDNLEAETFEKAQPYIEAIRQMMRAVALGQVPSGYVLGMARGAKNIPSCRQNGLSFNFKDGQRLTGHNLDLFIGVVKNVSASPIEFNEMSCGSWQTAAVASYPLHVLQPGQMSEVYIVMKEPRMPVPRPQRPSLIPRDYGYR